MPTREPVRVLHQTFSGSYEKGTNHSGVSLGLSISEEDIDFGLPQDVADRLVRRTELRVSQVISQSKFVQSNCQLYKLPRFDRDDMEIGEMIAYGGFSNVHEILSFNVETDLVDDSESSDEDQKMRHRQQRNKDDSDLEDDEDNDNSTDNDSTTITPTKYVIKNLNPKLAFNPKKLLVGAKDLVMEAHFLAALDHRNIIKLKGWSSSGIAGFSASARADGFFLLFDRLEATLSKRIASWKEESKRKVKHTLIKSSKNSSIKKELFAERVQTAIDISDAMTYLHKHRILYRDLKPANVGYDSEGTLKMFDFGLAVELPESDDPNQTYNLAGNTGTSRYMAVEVIRKQPYNCKADVFSYSILLWELMALTKPYDGLVGHQVKECVSVFGERPSIPRSWPTPIRRLLRRGWAENLVDRPVMSEVRDVLKKLLETTTKPSKFFGERKSTC